jgi:hypothetical protein
MTTVAVAVVALALMGAGVAVGVAITARSRGRSPAPLPETPGQILFPFVGEALSVDALDCALRLAAAEHAMLIPVFLARVPLMLPLDVALPGQGAHYLCLQEVIEQRAAMFAVPVARRIQRGLSAPMHK